MKTRHLPVATIAVAATAVLALLAGLVALGSGQAQAQTPTPTPAVDLTGEWGYVYSMGGAFGMGGCVVTYSQTDSSFVSTPGGLMQCDDASDGAVTGTLKGPDGLTMNFQIAFAGSVLGAITVNVTGTVSADGNTQEGDWSIKSQGYAGTYLASRLIPTSAGSNVTVDFPGAGATLTFDEVAAEGASQIITAPTTGGILPGDFQVLGEFYNVLTNAAISGGLNFCVSYQDKDGDGVVDGTSPPLAETDLQLLHNEGGTFVDRTDVGKTDYILNQICAVVPSLSEFALGAQAEPSVGGISVDADLGALPLETAQSSGPSAGVLAAIAAAVITGAVALGGAAWYAWRQAVGEVNRTRAAARRGYARGRRRR